MASPTSSLAPEWLTAALAPWSMAPHPNFSVTSCSPAEYFALVIDNRYRDRNQYAKVVDWSFDWEQTLTNAASDSFLDGKQGDAVTRLCEVQQDPSVPLGATATAALLAAIALADLDHTEESCNVLQVTLDTIATTESATHRLIAAVLHQQLAVRQSEVGRREESWQNAGIAADLTEGKLSSLERFKTSKGTLLTSSKLQNEIRLGTARNAQALLSHLEPIGGKRWVDIVRDRRPWLGTAISSMALRGADEFIDDVFDRKLRSIGRPHKLGSTPASASAFRALVSAEMQADLHSIIVRREQLAKLRLLEEESLSPTMVADALSMLQRADRRDTLEATIRWARANGPLTALSIAASKVIDRPSFGDRVSRGDVAIISGAADVLSAKQADRAVEATFTYMRGEGRRGLDYGVVSNWSMQDVAIRALADLAPSAPDRQSEIATLILETAQKADHLYALNSGLISLAKSLDWGLVSPKVAESWIAWALSLAEVEESLDLAVAVTDAVRGVEYTREHLPRPAGLALGARLLLESFSGLPAGTAELETAVEACVSIMDAQRQQALQGVRHIGGYQEVEIGTALVLTWPDFEELWNPIVESLRTTSIGNFARTGALDRIAEAPTIVPPAIVEAMSEFRDEILRSDDADAFTDPVPPTTVLPSAVRALTALKILAPSEVATWVAQFAASTHAVTRRQAAATARVIASTEPASAEWALMAVMQLAHDSDPVVRAESAAVLSSMLGHHGDLSLAGTETLRLLLQAPGITVPLNALRGIEGRLDLGEPIAPDVTRVVRDLGESHPSRSVRKLVRKIAELDSGR